MGKVVVRSLLSVQRFRANVNSKSGCASRISESCQFSESLVAQEHIFAASYAHKIYRNPTFKNVEKNSATRGIYVFAGANSRGSATR
jgi:hypothetical protein